ncbi:hypothetical protein EB820_04930 [Brevibacillus agri]|uniref:BIG2 domain-containing protein n=1 Tax=Brevibacillus agri TaxID=51101 RepID=A0A3M8B6X2_9BACL|nr:hypothetical protein BA6348_21680 [Brevibacillus agri]RNB59110.1 hypothetical protein EB820_04930 [Brevibacillus agri]
MSWSSSAPDVATVDEDGTVTPKSPGTAVITVTTADGNKTASAAVIVKKKKAAFQLETSVKKILLRPNGSASFRVFAVDSEGKRKSVTLSPDTAYSSHSPLLHVKRGSVKAGKDAGEATFTVHHLGEERDIQVVITKARLTSLKASAKELVLKPGETMQLELIATWSDETERDVGKQAVWTSRNKSVVEVTDTGELTAIQAGASTIRADYGDRVVLVRVTVRPDEDALEKQTTQFANRLFLT